MKKTIGLSPLEEYLSGSKKSKGTEKNPDQRAPMQQAVPESKEIFNQGTVVASYTAPEKALEYVQSAPELNALANAQPDHTLRAEAPRGEQLTLDALVNPQQAAANSKQRITLHISADIIDRVKNAVYWEPGLTIAGFAEEALEKALNDLEAERGAAFPRRKQHRLRGGRPLI